MADPCLCGYLNPDRPKGYGAKHWCIQGSKEIGHHVWRKQDGECRPAQRRGLDD
jgi:hypothetical protein